MIIYFNDEEYWVYKEAGEELGDDFEEEFNSKLREEFPPELFDRLRENSTTFSSPHDTMSLNAIEDTLRKELEALNPDLSYKFSSYSKGFVIFSITIEKVRVRRGTFLWEMMSMAETIDISGTYKGDKCSVEIGLRRKYNE